MEREPRPKLPRAIDMPPPAKGVAQEVFTESAGSSAFLHRTKAIMGRENPTLLEFVVAQSVSSPLELDIMKWGMRYYEVNYRTARRSGKPLVRVGEDVLRIMMQEDIQARNSCENTEALADFFEKKNQRRHAAVRQQSNNSEGLDLFWTVFKDYAAQMDGPYQGAYPSLLIWDTLHDMRESIHRQANVNMLDNKWDA